MADDARADTATIAQEVIALWPEGPPTKGKDLVEVSYLQPALDGTQITILRNVSEPTLTVFRPSGQANGVGVIVAPGGGWRILAWEHEGVDVAEWLAARGYTAFLLKYRVAATPDDPAEFAASMARVSAPLAERRKASEAPKAIENLLRDDSTNFGRKISIEDGRRALAIVRERAATWGVDPDRIGMMGFSAGAFLTIDVALSGDGGLAFVAPIYGGGAAGRPIPADAPPLFTCIAQDDRLLFRVVEGLYRDWSEADRPSEIHVFRRGGHGFGMVKQGAPVDGWIDLLGAWLADLGFK
ncbi:MAG TPA: alpha/beta hydrolase [Caulobacteraceae bacterium]|nr:alpha/beta hydrolase [Caulobacteraceae bacterium]